MWLVERLRGTWAIGTTYSAGFGGKIEALEGEQVLLPEERPKSVGVVTFAFLLDGSVLKSCPHVGPSSVFDLSSGTDKCPRFC
jgi:hypothetical protein